MRAEKRELLSVEERRMFCDWAEVRENCWIKKLC